MRLLALVHKEPGRAPGQRFRLEQWAPHLVRDHGIELEFAAFESRRLAKILYQRGRYLEKGVALLLDTLRRHATVANARAYDAVVVYREAAMLGPAIYERLLASRNVPIIYDFDDAIWLRQTGSVNGPFVALRMPSKTGTICRLAAGVSVGNEYLANYARQWNRTVAVVPTSIDIDQYQWVPPPNGDQFVICWIGSHSTLHHLELARTAIERFSSRRKTTVRVICDRPLGRPFANAETIFVPWSAASEAHDVASAHVGIMPLPDDAFARGKCACKALQYMAAGRPVIASPVGVNVDIIRHLENGVLASTTNDWIDALEALANSSELRQRLGDAGRQTVVDSFCARSSAARFATLVRQATRTG